MVGLYDAMRGVSQMFKSIGGGETYSKGLALLPWGMFPTVAILVKAGG